MKILAGLSLILVVLLISLSAYLRLAHSGIGCADWPECYGRIGLPPAASSPPTGSPTTNSTYQNLLDEAARPLAWATPLHRLVASVLGLLVLFLALVALRHRRHRLLTLALLALTVYLAVLGIRSGSLHDPAVVMGNLVGGFALLGLLAWLWFSLADAGRPRAAASGVHGPPRALLVTATALLASQIILGGLTSANFAATACRTLPDCHGSWWPGPELRTALDLTRTHQVTASGQAIGGTERIAIHQAHRLGAVVAGLVILLTGLLAWRGGRPWRTTGILVSVLVVTGFGVGVAAILADLPIILAVTHNWLAALLLISLIRLLALQRASRPHLTPA